MRNSSGLDKAITRLLIATTTALPIYGYAAGPPNLAQNFLSQTGREGQTFGNDLKKELKDAPAQVQNGIVTVPTRANMDHCNIRVLASSASTSCFRRAGR